MLIPVFLSLALQSLLPGSEARAFDQMIKVADGSWAICQSAEDSFHHMHGTYRMDIVGPQIKSDWLVFNVKVEFLACKKNSAGAWGFTPVPTHAPLRYEMENEQVTVHTKDVFLTLSKGNQFISSLAWDPGSRLVAIGINEALSEEDLAKYKAGDEIETSIDFQLEKNILIVGKDGNASDERFSFGTHKLSFKLKR